MAEVGSGGARGETLRESSKGRDVRKSNIIAAKCVADTIRTSLGPRGMDKMIQQADGKVVISNDGATIMTQMKVEHPTAKMLVELSKAQDIEAGDGTTSVVVICGALLNACEMLLTKGIHPTAITEAFQMAAAKAEERLEEVAIPVDFDTPTQLIHTVNTCLSSKVISSNAAVLSPIAVDAVMNIIDKATATNVDLNDIKIVRQVGGTIDESELVQGVVFNKGVSHAAGGPTRLENAKIGLCQFWLSAPKTDVENYVVVSDYAAMDRILREERKYILGLCKKIKKSGCNVLLVQKSILRDAVNDLSLHFLAKMGIMVIKDVERDDVEFCCRTLGCRPVAHIDQFTAERLGSADLVEEVTMRSDAGSKVVKLTGVPNAGATQTILLRGSNKLVLAEADRSVHDALCVVRSLVKKRFVISGGGSAEAEIGRYLGEHADSLQGMQAYCVKAFAQALEAIPLTLAENAGMNPIEIVTELRKQHMEGKAGAGINVRKGCISDMVEENVLQPLLVSTSAISLATECVRMILKIDDIVAVM
jgi:T-complex protein 1 subunit delta